jgi:hypothetical protein
MTWFALSNATKLPVCTFTAPTLKRICLELMRSKSTSRSRVSRNGAVS